MNYAALKHLRKRVEKAQSIGAINAFEAMALMHHIKGGGRYASYKTKFRAGEIAKKVRLSVPV